MCVTIRKYSAGTLAKKRNPRFFNWGFFFPFYLFRFFEGLDKGEEVVEVDVAVSCEVKGGVSFAKGCAECEEVVEVDASAVVKVGAYEGEAADEGWGTRLGHLLDAGCGERAEGCVHKFGLRQRKGSWDAEELGFDANFTPIGEGDEDFVVFGFGIWAIRADVFGSGLVDIGEIG